MKNNPSRPSEKHLSAASAPPMAVQNANLAGASVDGHPESRPAMPEEEKAAARSRDKMAFYAPIHARESAGECRTRVEAVVDRMIAIPPSRDDPSGSYTGRPVIEGETPVQDADDL